jgi:hypothetical protein
MKKLEYTYWAAKEGGFIGYINDYPDYWTEGDTREELQRMIVSLYGDVRAMGNATTPISDKED